MTTKLCLRIISCRVLCIINSLTFGMAIKVCDTSISNTHKIHVPVNITIQKINQQSRDRKQIENIIHHQQFLLTVWYFGRWTFNTCMFLKSGWHGLSLSYKIIQYGPSTPDVSEVWQPGWHQLSFSVN